MQLPGEKLASSCCGSGGFRGVIRRPQPQQPKTSLEGPAERAPRASTRTDRQTFFPHRCSRECVFPGCPASLCNGVDKTRGRRGAASQALQQKNNAGGFDQGVSYIASNRGCRILPATASQIINPGGMPKPMSLCANFEAQNVAVCHTSDQINQIRSDQNMREVLFMDSR